MAGLGGIGGVGPILTSVLLQPFQAVALRPGDVLRGIVQSIEPQTLVRFGSLVVPVEKTLELRPGQAVSAEVVRSDAGLQLRIATSPLSTASNPTETQSGAAPPDLPSIIVDALQALGKLDFAEQAVSLVPREIAANPVAVRLVLSLLLDRGDESDASGQLARILQRAIDEGVLSEADVRGVLPALTALNGEDAAEIAPALQKVADASQRPLAARLAQSIAKHGTHRLMELFTNDVPSSLAKLAEHGPFTEFLRQTGQLAEYHHAVEHLAERFAAAQLVNARGADAPYLFIALPVPADAPLRHAHLHIMGEGGGKTQRFDAKNATVVLDLSTSALGDLWITLTTAHGMCSCSIRARELDAVAALDAHAGELAARLADAGYSGAQVQTALWDGDRVRALAAMMRRFRGIDLEA